MSATGIKLGSLIIKTLAKPIASRIRQQAREHPRFRKVCITVAQRIHQVDVRLRLGLLQDTAAFVKAEQVEREAARQAAKKAIEGAAKFPAELGTVSSTKPIPPPAVFGSKSPSRPEPTKRARVRPLTESKAIESGANFISEFFLFTVAGVLILAEQIRGRRKEASRRDEIAERLEMLESRTRQDQIRLAELEEKGHHDEERMLVLEEENWRLNNQKGAFPGRISTGKNERKTVEPTPLWEEVSGAGTSLWTKIFEFGIKSKGVTEGAANEWLAAQDDQNTNKDTRKVEERGSGAAFPTRTPAVIKKVRPILNPESPTSDKTEATASSHLSK